MTFFGPSMTGKPVVEARGADFGEFPVTVEACVLSSVRPVFSFFEKQLPQPFVRNAEEVLEGSWSFWIELPHTERPSLAREDPVD